MKQAIPAMYSRNPKIYFDPERPGAENAAKIYELAVNAKWPKRKMKQTMRDGIKSTKLYGTCGFKTFFFFQEKGAVQDEWDDRIENDDVRTDRVALPQLLKDSESTWKGSPWIGHEITAPIVDIAKKFKVRKRDITVTGSSFARETNCNKESPNIPSDPAVISDFQFGTYYEIEDRRNKKVLIIVEGIDRVVEKKEKDYPYDTMYDFLEYNDLPDRTQTLSDYAFWRQQLEEVSVYRTMLLQAAIKGTSKYKAFGPELDETQTAQLTTSATTSIVQLSAGQDIQPFQHAPIDPQIFQAQAAARGDIQLISKQAPRQNSGGDKTATEVKAIEFAAQEVESENLERLEEVITSIAMKWAKLMFKNYSVDRTIGLTEMSESAFIGLQDEIEDSVVGTAKRPFVVINKKALSPEVAARVESGSTAPDNDAVRRQKLQGFMQMTGANKQLAAGVDWEAMLGELVDAFDLRNDNITIRKDNPMEESRLLNAGVFIPAMMNEQHEKHLPVHKEESNDNLQNKMHIASHEIMLEQQEQNEKASQAIAQQQAPQTGRSMIDLLGAAPLPGGPESPLAGSPLAPQGPVGPAGGLPPQGV